MKRSRRMAARSRGMTYVLAGALCVASAAGAQGTDGRPVSPLSLLAGPADPIAYREARLEVPSLLRAGRAAEAEPLAESLVRDYPRDGENWLLLGHTKRMLAKHAEAAPAYRRAGELMGWGVPNVASFLAAAADLAAGDRPGALAELSREVFDRHSILRRWPFDYSGFASLRSDSAFLRIVGRPDHSRMSRDEGWAADIQFLYDEVRRVDFEYRDRPLPAEFERRFRALKADVPRLSDEALFVGMERLLAVLRHGETGLLSAPKDRFLPLFLYAFPDGLYVVDAGEPAKGLIGSRVVRIGDVAAEEALRRMGATRSAFGDMETLWDTRLLASVYRLRGLGIVGAGDSVPLTVLARGGSPRTVRLGTVAEPPVRKLVPPKGVAAPLFLRNVLEAHWDAAMPEAEALYVQLNQVSNEPGETLQQYGVRLRSRLSETGAKRLILDLRHNNGGSTALYPSFLRTVIAFTTDPAHQLYVLIGRNTYSATANLITDLERLASPVFVGEASSACCHFDGDPSAFTLPYSGIAGEATGVRWNLSWNVFDARREMSPHVPVQLTADAYFAGRDPVLETVLRLIAKGR